LTNFESTGDSKFDNKFKEAAMNSIDNINGNYHMLYERLFTIDKKKNPKQYSRMIKKILLDQFLKRSYRYRCTSNINYILIPKFFKNEQFQFIFAALLDTTLEYKKSEYELLLRIADNCTDPILLKYINEELE